MAPVFLSSLTEQIFINDNTCNNDNNELHKSIWVV